MCVCIKGTEVRKKNNRGRDKDKAGQRKEEIKIPVSGKKGIFSCLFYLAKQENLILTAE